jgi:hypothetical protein
MKRLEKKKREQYVRVMIGEAETGFSGVRGHIKIITLRDTTVDKVYEFLNSKIEEETKI